MNHQRRDYEIGKQDNTYSHGRHIASDAIRGFVSGLRGYMEGRKMKREAKDAREARIANEAFRWKALDMQERQIQLDDAFREKELGVKEQQGERAADTADKSLDLQSTMQQAYFQHQKEMADIQAKIAQTQTELEQANREGLMDKAALIEESLTKLKSDLAIVEADAEYAHRRGLQQDTADQASKLQKEGADQASALSEQESGQRQNEIRTTGEEARKTQEEKYNLIEEASESEYNRKAEQLLTSGVQTDSGRSWLKSIIDDIGQDLSYKTLRNSAVQWATILGTAKNATPTAADDIALLNTFQRLIDPGVSVREGDVDLLQKTMDFIGKLKVELTALGAEDGRRILSDEARNEFIQTAYNIVSRQQELMYSRVKANTDKMLDHHEETRNMTFEDIVPQIFFENPTGTADSGRVQGTETTEVQELDAEWIEKITQATIDTAVPIIDADPNFDEADKQQVRQKLEATLKAMGEKAGVGDAYLKHADEIFNNAMELLFGEAVPPDNPEE